MSNSFIESLESRLHLAAHGIDPYNLGKGDWIWVLSSARASAGVSTNLQLFQYLKNKGMKWVIVKASQESDPNFNGTQFNAQLVADAHTAGLKLFAYQYVKGSNPAGEAAAAKAVIARGADGFVIDAEGEYERLANNAAAATTYMTSIRASYPDLFVAHAPFPIVSYHSAFPYYTFGKYADAVMTQDYFDLIGVTPTRMNQWRNDEWNALYNGWRGTGQADAIKPIVPISQGWNAVEDGETLTAAEIAEFANAVKGTANPASPGGYNGLSWWSVQHHTAEHWSAIGQVNVDPVFKVGQTIRVTGTGAAGLKAWSDSSSAAPATYVVEPEGAVGTVVSGPVFAAGYNRWRVRFKGETVDRWCAQDFLAAAPAPGAPTYVSPANGATFTIAAPTLLDWNDVPVATSYDVYLDGVLRANVAASQYALTGVSAGVHMWQVRAKNSAGTAAGTTWIFSYIPPPAKPASPTPADGSRPQVAMAKLDWADAANATSYDVYFDDVLAGSTTTSEWALAAPPTAKTAHVWRVVAKNAGSSVSSDAWSFTLDPIAGDANVDGWVDSADFARMIANMGRPGGWESGDFNGNGTVDFADYQVLEGNFGRVAPAPPVVAGATVASPSVVAELLSEPSPAEARLAFSVVRVARPKPAPARRTGLI